MGAGIKPWFKMDGCWFSFFFTEVVERRLLAFSCEGLEGEVF
jgi:hypothetical protein